MKRIAITGACGQISYSLLFKLINGDLFGKDEKIALHLLDLPPFLNALEGVALELQDCASNLLKEVIVGTDPNSVFEGVDYAFLVGAKPRGPGMERKELLNENAKIFVEHGRALNTSANKDVKVLVVGNPCNTNCLIAMKSAPDINPSNFHAMTRLDQNRATGLIAKKAGVSVDEVSHVTIWGNHSLTQVPDYLNTKIKGKRAAEVINDDQWLQTEFIKTVQQRGAEIIAKRGKSSAASAANAAVDAMKAIAHPTKEGAWYSSAILSDNNPYKISNGLIFSFPCITKKDGSVEIVKDLESNDFLRQKIILTEKELKEEKELIKDLI